ncbi:hypothetical protein NQZ68_001375 [Dissostichus eleginoides]|nr:hypothetical protein NQZ68_001375 [Dissostichus eleginoides]
MEMEQTDNKDFSGEILTAEFTFKAERITRRCANIPTDNELITWRHYDRAFSEEGAMLWPEALL